MTKKFDSNKLLVNIVETRAQIELLKVVSKDKFFNHPFLGNLKLKQTIRFLEIHTQHHLDIIHKIYQMATYLTT